MKKILRNLIKRLGFDIVKYSDKKKKFPVDFGNSDIKIIKEVLHYTMTSRERIFSLIRAVEYIVRHVFRVTSWSAASGKAEV